MSAILSTFIEKRYDWLVALFEHFYISTVSLLAALIIALPLAILLSRYKKPSEFVLHITGILQTIPSLALLGLLIPFFGIGRLPAIITLTLYAMFPILQNTVTGLNAIDPSLEEAAAAFGMTKWEKLKKFELALALLPFRKLFYMRFHLIYNLKELKQRIIQRKIECSSS